MRRFLLTSHPKFQFHADESALNSDADAPRLTASMRIALEDLALDRLMVVYPGDRRFTLAENVEVVPAAELAENGAALFTA